MDLVVVADPIAGLDPTIDTTLGLIAAARGRGHRVQVCEPQHLAVVNGRAHAHARPFDDPADRRWIDLDLANVVLFRTDPPVDRTYLDATLILDRVDRCGPVLVNDPRGIRLVNEKLWALAHPDLGPPTLVAADPHLIADFVDEHRECVIKPIDGHAGRGVLRLDAGDPNRESIVELLTRWGTKQVVVQRWLGAVRSGGNKRIFLHGGRPAGAVLRFPGSADFRIGMPARIASLSARDLEICERVGPELAALGLVLVGLDVIDGCLIEVNVTSSGALHKSDRLLGTSLCTNFVRFLETTTTRSIP